MENFELIRAKNKWDICAEILRKFFKKFKKNSKRISIFLTNSKFLEMADLLSYETVDLENDFELDNFLLSYAFSKLSSLINGKFFIYFFIYFLGYDEFFVLIPANMFYIVPNSLEEFWFSQLNFSNSVLAMDSIKVRHFYCFKFF